MNILFIVGSFRKDSFNEQLANKTREIIGDRANVSFLDYRDVPLYNQDLEEGGFPESVLRVRQAVKDADALWIFTPEYNLMMPGILKNLLDWLSRANDPSNYLSGIPVMGKPVTVSGAGGKSEAQGAVTQLLHLLILLRMDVMDEDYFGFAIPGDQMRSGKWTITENDIKRIETQVNAFLKFIVRDKD